MFTFVFGIMIFLIILAFEIIRLILKLFGIHIPSLFSYRCKPMTREEEEWYYMQQRKEEEEERKNRKK